jgi:hypothetical protein
MVKAIASGKEPYGSVLCLLLWVGAATAALYLKGHDFLDSQRPPATVVQFAHNDYSQDWLPARNFFVGAPVYEPLRTAFPRHFDNAAFAESDGIIPYNAHPPGSVLLWLPFALLDFPSALRVWNAAALAALAVSLLLLCRVLYDRYWHWALVPVACVVACSNPVHESLNQGQMSCLLLLCLSAAWLAQRQRACWIAGGFLALATFLKLFPGLFFLTLLFQRDFRTFRAGLVWLLGFVFLGMAVLGVDNNVDYVRRVLPVFAHDHMASWSNHSLTGLWSKLFNPGRPSFVPLVQSPVLQGIATAATWAGVLFLLWQTAQRERHDRANDATFPMTVVAAVLLSPVAWNHYFVLLLLPIAWLYLRLPVLSWAGLGLVLCTALLWLPEWTVWKWTLPNHYRTGTLPPLDAFHTATGMSVQLYAVLGLLVLCRLAAFQRDGVSQEASCRHPVSSRAACHIS